LLVHHLQHDMADPVIGVAGAIVPVGAKGTAGKFAVAVTIEWNAHAFEPDDVAARLLGESSDHGAVVETVTGDQRIFGKFGGGVITAQGGIEAAKRDAGISSQRMNL